MTIGIPQEQPPVEDHDRLREWLSRMMLLINGAFAILRTSIKTELIAISTINQFPPVADQPLKIVYDASEDGVYGGINVTAAGDFTILQDDDFIFEIFLSAGRLGNNLTSFVLLWAEIDGAPAGVSRAYSMSDNQAIEPMFAAVTAPVVAGQVINFWVTTDSSGITDGGLRALVPTNPAIPIVPSARIVVKRLIPTEH